MKASELRKNIRELGVKQGELEAQIASIVGELDEIGVGVKGSLVDSEGFPRSDVDIYYVRTQRHTLAVLQNDYKSLMTEIENKFKELSIMPSDEKGSAETKKTPKEQIKTSLRNQRKKEIKSVLYPFLEITAVDVNSPAEKAGLLVGDHVLRFGSVVSSNGTISGADALQLVVSEVSANVNKNMDIVVLRNSMEVAMIITPKRWDGNGLLGCKLNPLS